jgi:hypothetical protein
MVKLIVEVWSAAFGRATIATSAPSRNGLVNGDSAHAIRLLLAGCHASRRIDLGGGFWIHFDGWAGPVPVPAARIPSRFEGPEARDQEARSVGVRQHVIHPEGMAPIRPSRVRIGRIKVQKPDGDYLLTA